MTSTRIQIKRGTAASWTAANPILSVGELGLETDTSKLKVGNGSTAWNSLSYFPVEWSAITSKPTYIAAGASQAAARSEIGAAAAADRGQPNGLASLDSSGLVPSSQLPSYVDDVVEAANAAALPATGETGKIYTTLDNGKIFRWSGSAYAEISPSPGSTDAVPEGSTNLYFTNDRADARIANAVGVSVQAYDSDLAAFALKTAPTGDVVGTSDTQTLTAKTLTNPTINNYTEGVVAVGTVSSAHTLNLANGTVQTATLTASTACTFTMPTATAGKSFTLLLRQAASTGGGTATFTGVKWANGGTAPTMTATAGRMDIFTFFSDGTNWYGSAAQNYTP